jgi:plasmid rolling circle replication initiator protein Rep
VRTVKFCRGGAEALVSEGDPWDNLECLALGELGLSVRDFYSMTLRELSNVIKGRSKKEEKDLQWALYNARLISFYACAPHLGKSSSIKKPADLFELEIDKEMKRQRIKRLKPIKKILRDQQSNG